MALTDLLFTKGSYLASIKLDVTISEGATATARVTKNPVEFGADMNDHIIIDPMTYVMEGAVSNASTSIIGAALSILDRNKAQSAWEDLLDLMITREPFDLIQNLKTYENVVLTSLKESQDKDTSNGLLFTATLSEVVIVGTDTEPNVTYEDQDTSDQLSPQTQGGFKQAGAA